MITKPAHSSMPLHSIIQNRWSPKSFDADKNLERETLTALFEAARWAPSCFNDQPWRFIVCNKATDEAAWRKLLGTLAEKNQLWAKNAPVLLLSIAMHEFGHNSKPNRWSAYDTGAASISLSLQATALGLVTHQMGGFDAEQCRDLFGLPEACSPMAVIAVGYQASTEQLNEEFKETELRDRTRKQLQECFYFGHWQQ